MNIAEWLRSINVVDVVIILFLFGMFILGYIQGTIRRLVGIASIVFSFFLALQLNEFWLGSFLAQNWEQFPPEYSTTIGYLLIFVAASVAFSLVIQGTYKKAEIFPKYPVVDELLGGILGVVQGFLILRPRIRRHRAAGRRQQATPIATPAGPRSGSGSIAAA